MGPSIQHVAPATAPQPTTGATSPGASSRTTRAQLGAMSYAQGAAALSPNGGSAAVSTGYTSRPASVGSGLTVPQVMAQVGAVTQSILVHRLQAIDTAERDQAAPGPTDWSRSVLEFGTHAALAIVGGLLTDGAITWLATTPGKQLVGAALGQLPGLGGALLAQWQDTAEKIPLPILQAHVASAVRGFVGNDTAALSALITRCAGTIPAGTPLASAYFQLQRTALPDIMQAGAATVNFRLWPDGDSAGVVASLMLLGALERVANAALTTQYLGSVLQWCRMQESLRAKTTPTIINPLGRELSSLAGRSQLGGVLTIDSDETNIAAAHLEDAEPGIVNALRTRADLQAVPLRALPNVSILLRDAATQQPVVWIRDGRVTQWLADPGYWRARATASGRLPPSDPAQCRGSDGPIITSLQQEWLTHMLSHPFREVAQYLTDAQPRLSREDIGTVGRDIARTTPTM